MGCITRVQVIERANNNRQFYFICPAPLAQALEMEKGEEVEWVIEDRETIVLKRAGQKKRVRGKAKESRDGK